MSPKELTAFRIHPELMEGLRHIKERDGVPLSVQVERALRTWLELKGVALKPVLRGQPARRKG
jgi:hypothetical protein